MPKNLKVYTDEPPNKKQRENEHEILPGAGCIFGSINEKTELERKMVGYQSYGRNIENI